VTTLAEAPAPVRAYDDFDPASLRDIALLAISTGMTADQVRAWRKTAGQEVSDAQLAGEIGYLAERGVTGRVVRRVFRERDQRNPAYRDRPYTVQDARDIAKIYLASGMTSAALREHAGLRGDRKERRETEMAAAQMDALTAANFDARAYAKKIGLTAGGAR
jgi:hypothetical protein